MSNLSVAPTSVYQYYDADGELLYVGVTARGFSRGKEHERTKAWWPLVTSSSVEHYPNREEALRREAYLISYWRPPHNTMGRPSGPPRHRRQILPVDYVRELVPERRAVRALLGRLGRCNSLHDLDLNLIEVPALADLITEWKAVDTPLTAARAHLAHILRNED